MKITQKKDGTFQIAGITEEMMVKLTGLLQTADRDPEISDAVEQVTGSLEWKRVPRNGWKGPLHNGLMAIDRFNTLIEKVGM